MSMAPHILLVFNQRLDKMLASFTFISVIKLEMGVSKLIEGQAILLDSETCWDEERKELIRQNDQQQKQLKLLIFYY